MSRLKTTEKYLIAPGFGERIASSRVAAGLKTNELADILKVTPESVSRWEREKSSPQRLVWGPLGKALGVSPIWILSGRGPRVWVAPEEEQSSAPFLLPALEEDEPQIDWALVSAAALVLEGKGLSKDRHARALQTVFTFLSRRGKPALTPEALANLLDSIP